MFDVVISGAGPSGSKSAEILAKAGFKVALLEKDTNWRKPCGGGVSSRIFKYYPQLKKYDYHKINGVSMYSSDYDNLDYSWGDIRESSINVDRLEFDNVIRNVAIDSGAELFDKHVSYDFVYKNGKKIGVKAKSKSGSIDFLGKILIIADGMSSKLANKSGLRKKWQINDMYQAKCAIMEGELSLDSTKISLFFQKYKGYGWIFPLKDNHFNIGCGTCNEDNAKYNLNDVYNNFLKEPFIKKILSGSNYKTHWSGAYPMPGVGVIDRALYGDNLMIVGDAAGFVSPISGEGIHPSIVSGEAAAYSAINALENENISKESLKSYKKYPNVKKIIRNFKMKLSLVEFFFENKGKQLNALFKLAKSDDMYREEVINMFLFNKPLSRELLQLLKTT
ncbi:MAG: geranylgeranyl reductase family protein [Promethearchaeota archaeon]